MSQSWKKPTSWQLPLANTILVHIYTILYHFISPRSFHTIVAPFQPLHLPRNQEAPSGSPEVWKFPSFGPWLCCHWRGPFAHTFPQFHGFRWEGAATTGVKLTEWRGSSSRRDRKLTLETHAGGSTKMEGLVLQIWEKWTHAQPEQDMLFIAIGTKSSG